MWDQRIIETPFYNEASNSFFEDKVFGYSIDNDVTFVSTLRALVYPRMKEEDSLYLTYERYSTPAMSEITDTCTFEGFRDIRHQMSIVNFIVYDNNRRDIDALEEKLLRLSPLQGYESVPKVKEFFRKYFPVLCLIKPEDRATVVITCEMTTKKMNYMQCAIPAFLPWYFNPADGYSDDEMALIKSFQNTSQDVYMELLAKYAEKYDFKEQWIRKALEGFESLGLKRNLEYANSDIKTYIQKIADLAEKINEYMGLKREKEIYALGLKAMIDTASSDSEIANFVIRSKNVDLKHVEGEQMEFYVKDYLRFWELNIGAREIEDEYLSNDRTIFYKPDGYEIPEDFETLKKFWTAIFVDQTLKVKMFATYRMKLGEGIYALGRNEIREDECPGYMFNPHIYYHRCLGGFQSPMADCVGRGDYLGAIDQCIASCQNINVQEEGATMSPFIRDLYKSKQRCIEFPKGDCMTPKEAIKFIREGGSING